MRETISYTKWIHDAINYLRANYQLPLENKIVDILNSRYGCLSHTVFIE